MAYRESLQAANLNGSLALLDHDACAFAQNFGRANPSAAFPKNIRFEDHARRPAQIRGHDALDKSRHIDSRRTGLRAGSVKAIEAARGLDCGLSLIQLGRDIRKVLLVFFRRQPRRGLAKRHALTSNSKSPLKHTTRWTLFPPGFGVQDSSDILAPPHKSNPCRI